MGFFDSIKKWLSVAPLPPQMVHYRGTGPLEGERMHLRVEPGGRGVLVIHASKVIHLNQTATEFARCYLEGFSEEKAVKEIRKRYGVKPAQALSDYRDVVSKIQTLADTDEICPVSYLGLSRIEPGDVTTSAPERMDIALTYACNDACAHCYVEREKSMRPLPLERWKEVLGKLWDAGIPHVCFTGGEATLSPDLPALIEHAEEIGIVTGLLTNGRRLADAEFTRQLVEVGLDHVQITLESHDAAIHDAMVGAPGAWEETVQGIKNALAETIYLVTNTTLCKKNAAGFLETLEFLHDLGVENFACNGFIHSGDAVNNPDGIDEAELPALLESIRDKAAELDMNFIWYTPTQYCSCNPIELELGHKRCTAGISNMCIEPDGSVIPCQSYFETLGNILTDDWKTLWNHETLVTLREREWVEEACKQCDQIETCGGGCPLYAREKGVAIGRHG